MSVASTAASMNYDSTVATHYKHCGCRYEDPRQEALAHESFSWTLEHTSDATRQFLSSLPFRIDIRPFGGHVSGPTIRLVHGNHALNTVYVTEERTDEFLSTMAKNMSARDGDVVCFGHTHKPWHRIVAGIHFVNTGSVGRPKDGDPRAGYVVLDVTEAGVNVDFVRVAYDVEEAARGILASTLPPDFAEYLRTGGMRERRSELLDFSLEDLVIVAASSVNGYDRTIGLSERFQQPFVGVGCI